MDMDVPNINTRRHLDNEKEDVDVSDLYIRQQEFSKVNTTVGLGTEQENTRISTIFRNLATGKYMADFDYMATNFTFRAVYYANAYSYCFCICAFEHERIDYIPRPGEINEETYERVLRCILDEKCEHVDDVPQEYIKETRVYGIHIAVATGTIQLFKDFTDPVGKRYRYRDTKWLGHIMSYRWLYLFDPYQIALVKNWEIFQIPQLLWFIHDNDWMECQTHCYLDARRINTRCNKLVQMHDMSRLELCVRNENIQIVKHYINMINEDYPVHIMKALQLAFEHNLDEIADIILHHKNWISKCLYYVRRDYKWIKETCELSILYDKPKVLDDLLEELVKQMSVCEEGGVVGAKKEAIALVERLIQICKALQMKENTAVVLRFYRKLNGDVPDENCIFSKTEQTKVPGLLLIKHDLPVEKCISILNYLPNVSDFINDTDERGNCLHAFNHYMVYQYRKRTTFLKHLLDLGANVNVMNKLGMTPLVHLMIIKVLNGYPHPREAEELYIFQNPDIDVQNMNVRWSVLSCAVKSDKVFLKYKHDSTASLMSRFMVCWDYIMDGKLHGMSGHDGDDFALNFMVPFLIEAGFRVSESERREIASAMDKLHPSEQEYLKHWLNNPKPLKQWCRDVLRRHFNGLEIHRYVKTVDIPQKIKDFILLKPLLLCVSKELLD